MIHHQSGSRFILGELDGTVSERLQGVHGVLARAGIGAEVTAAIRREIWFKLWGNIAFNPLSVLTAATLDRMIADSDIRRLTIEIMNETERVANRLGIRFDIGVEQRIDVVKRLGAFKTSMLQDLEAGPAPGARGANGCDGGDRAAPGVSDADDRDGGGPGAAARPELTLSRKAGLPGTVGRALDCSAHDEKEHPCRTGARASPPTSISSARASRPGFCVCRIPCIARPMAIFRSPWWRSATAPGRGCC